LKQSSLSWRDELLFLLTNRVPRHALSHGNGMAQPHREPVLAHAALSVWRLFDDDFRLEEARTEPLCEHPRYFHAAVEGSDARPIDAPRRGDKPLRCHHRSAWEGRGRPRLPGQGLSLPPRGTDSGQCDGGQVPARVTFVTLRLKSSMYHRFHAPIHAQIRQVFYVSGDRWNVHPPALKKIEKAVLQERAGNCRMRR
jgi:phosphatidylserine decarboxylase